MKPVTSIRITIGDHTVKAELAEIEGIVESDTPVIRSRDVYHLVVIATYTEDLEILRPSFQAVADSKYDQDRLIVVLATEERDRDRARANARALVLLSASKSPLANTSSGPKLPSWSATILS